MTIIQADSFQITNAGGKPVLVRGNDFTRAPVALEKGDIIQLKNGDQITFGGMNGNTIHLSMSEKTFAGASLSGDTITAATDFMSRADKGLSFVKTEPVAGRGMTVEVSSDSGRHMATLRGPGDEAAAVATIMQHIARAVKNKDEKGEALIKLGFSEEQAATISKDTKVIIPGGDEMQGISSEQTRAPGILPVNQPIFYERPISPEEQEYIKARDALLAATLKQEQADLAKLGPREKVRELSDQEMAVHNAVITNNLMGLPNHVIPEVTRVRVAYEAAGGMLQSYDVDGDKNLSIAEITSAQADTESWGKLKSTLDVFGTDGKISREELQGALSKLPEDYKVYSEAGIVAALNTPTVQDEKKKSR